MKILKILEKKLSDFSVKKSFFIIFSIFFLIPLAVLTFFYVTFVYKVMLSWEEDKVHSSIVQASQTFSKYLDDVKDFSDRLYVNRPLRKILLTQYTDVQDVYADYSSLYFLESSVVNYKVIEGFRIYTENESLLDNSFISKVQDKTNPWYIKAIILKGQAFWQVVTDPVSKKENLCLIRSLWDNSEFAGVLVVKCGISERKIGRISSAYDSAVFAENTLLYTDIENVSAEENEIIVSFSKNYDFSENVMIRSKFRDTEIALKGMSFNFTPYSDMSFNILFMIPLNQLNAATFRMVRFSLVIIILIFLFFTLVISFYMTYLYSRFDRIRNGINMVVKNQFEIEKSIGGKDEFEEIYQALYKMSFDIKNLIQKVYIQDLEKQKMLSRQNEINFKMLCAQINPHFLFNTLESIRMKALSANDRETAKMLRLLASLLRYNLSLQEKPVLVKEELEVVECYLKIQKMRFGERFSYEIKNECDENDEILPLLIQPVVENAAKYALENKVEGGNLLLRSYKKNEGEKSFLIIEVSDDGDGIDEEKLSELNLRLGNSGEKNDFYADFPEYELLHSDNENHSFTPFSIETDGRKKLPGTSIGLENVNSRIKLFYGSFSGLFIQSQKGSGTLVTIKLEI